MSSIIYFGASPSPSQAIAPSLAEKGINLLRLAPKDVNWSGGPTLIQPGFSIYKNALPLFVKAAIENKVVPSLSSPYVGIQYGGKFLPIKWPDVVVTFNYALPDEVAQDLRMNMGAQDIVVWGKPAMSIPVETIEEMRKVRELKPVYTTPAPNGMMNVSSFTWFIGVMRIITGFLKIHQYPAFLDSEQVGMFEQGYALVPDSTDVPMATSEEGAAAPAPTSEMEKGMSLSNINLVHIVQSLKHMNFMVNLITPFEKARAGLHNNEIPQGDGLLFRYESDLAIYDSKTVPACMKAHFYGHFGNDEDEAIANFDAFQSAWGILHKTEAGKALSHLCLGIEMALRTQTRIIPLFPTGTYVGFLLNGSGYHLTILGQTYYPEKREEVAKLLTKMNPHDHSLDTIMKMIFSDEEERAEKKKEVTSMWKLKKYVDTSDVLSGLRMDEVKKWAKGLNFEEDEFWSINEATLSKALYHVSYPTIDISDFPLHHSALFSQDRVELVWSAFGSIAPSFRIPGGRAMSLAGSFTVKDVDGKSQGARVDRVVGKLAVRPVLLEIAIRDLKETISRKDILNPYGNSKIRMSQDHIDKSFAGAAAQKILASLRDCCKVTVVDKGKGKRRAEDEMEGSSSKRMKGLDW